jgi:NapC/NirT cytochrome c family, N-terminal region
MRPVVAAALRSRIAAIGVTLTTAGALLFFVLVALDLFGYLENPYAGIVVFILLPAIFVVGLLLIPLGLWWDRRRGRVEPGPVTFTLSDPNVRRTVLFVAVASMINLAIVSFASFGAVEYSESQAFCGQTCHPVMKPEFEAHQFGPHAKVHCVSCHVGPGAGAFLSAKFNGSRQLWLVASHTYHRPIPAPIHNLPPIAGTCENCHWPDRFIGDVTKVFSEYADDEANTETKTTVRLHVGGAVSGTGGGMGIHWHMNRSNVVEYLAADEAREKITYVKTTAGDGNVREYYAEGVTAADVAGKPLRRMDCTDCHNRAAHSFGSTPERAIDAAIGAGLIDKTIPFIRREAVKAVRATYASHEAADQEIDRSIRDALKARLPRGFEEAVLRRSIGVTQAIYRRNVFPEMNVTWGTYPNQIGHTTSNGCFRCHADTHKTRDGLTIKQDCESCHSIE